jgi:hypothetical protein
MGYSFKSKSFLECKGEEGRRRNMFLDLVAKP